MAVRLDIRPRLVLRDEPVAKVRRGFRLPPLTLPAVGYWLAMGALTYFFAHLGESPLESAFASAPPEPEPTFAPAPMPDVAPAPAHEPPPPPPVASPPLPEPEPEPEPDLASEAPTVAPEPEPKREPVPAPERSILNPHPSPLTREPEPRVAMTFPEFTDTSRAATRERAASGPRIDSDLFGDAPESREPSPEAPRAPESDAARPVAGLSCEAAVARSREEITIGGARGPADVTRDAYASILENGRYLSGCAVPDRTVFEVCAAVQNGRAVGVTVTSNPPNAALNGCVRRAVSRLRFPTNPRLDVTHTRFEAVRR
jgi:hypothetical protein